jgi:hypothetical protein
MNKLIAGIDEVATETQKVEGWCYFCISQLEYEKFQNEVKALLATNGKLKSFHGKKFIMEFKDEYEQFLRIIRKYAEISVPSFLCTILYSVDFKNQYKLFSERLTENVLKNNNVGNNNFLSICKKLTAELFEFMRLIESFGKHNELFVEIDSDNEKEKFKHLTTSIKGKDFEANQLITMLYNAYQCKQFPNSPILSDRGVSILKDQKSFAIQAADVIGNFSNSYIFYKLGDTSKRVEKGKIFEKVFGDLFDSTDFTGSIKLCGNSDLQLLNDGTLPMLIYNTQ